MIPIPLISKEMENKKEYGGKETENSQALVKKVKIILRNHFKHGLTRIHLNAFAKKE